MLSTTHRGCSLGIKFFVLMTLAAASAATGEQNSLKIPVAAGDLHIQLDSQGFAAFSAEDAQWLGETGHPRLPWRVVTLILPPDAAMETVSVALENARWEAIEGTWSVAPVPPEVAWDGERQIVGSPEGRQIVDGYDTSVYSAPTFWPGDDVRLLSTGRLRKWRLAQVAMPMFKYNPVQRTLTQLAGGEMVVSFRRSSSLPSLGAVQLQAEVTDRIGEDRVQRLAVNYADATTEYDSAALRVAGMAPSMVDPAVTPRFVIITTSTIQSASTKLASFVTHKQSQGFNVSVVTESQFGGGAGDTAANNIRNWLVNHYVTDNIEYVLLIGNPKPTPTVPEQPSSIPMKMLYPRGTGTDATAPSDIFYADLTGNWNLDGDAYYGEYAGDMGTGGIDRFWEVIVGRIPYYGTITDLDYILQKIMDYQNQPASSVAWRRSAILPMRDPDDWTAAFWLGEQVKNDTLSPAGWTWNRVYQSGTPVTPPPETTPCTMANVTNVWKNGAFGLMLWATHGSATSALDVMDTSYATQLNDGHPAFTVQCSCNNAYPEVTNNLCYTLLKKGAVCTLGDTRVSWYEQGQSSFNGSASNEGVVYEYASRLVADNMTAGHAIFDVTMVITPTSDKKWMNFCDFMIYGDPATCMLPRCGRRYVSASAAPGGDGTSWATAYKDLQSALDERATEIWVAAGTYKPDRGTASRSASFKLGGNTAIYGGFAGTETSREQRNPALNLTILSGDLAGNDGPNFTNNSENSYNVVISRGCDARSVLDGLTIRGGNANNSSGPIQDRGSGVHNRSGSCPTINNCIFTSNRAGYYAGALYNASVAASPTVTNCTFSGNASASCGGAVGNSTGSRARYTNCLFTANSSPYGGAMDSSVDSATIVNCDFVGNIATNGGGAIRCVASSATFVNCRFLGGSANTYGGALYNESGSPTATNCLFSGNTAAGIGGGAVYNSGTGNLRLTNCTIAGNAATSTYGNGGGLYASGATSTINNCIIWSNRDQTGYTETGQIYKYSGTLTINYSCVQHWTGAFGGTGNTGADPLLADPDGADNVAGTTDDNLHVLPGSSAIDAGSNTALPNDTLDMDRDGNTTEPLPIDLEGHVRFADDPNTTDTGSGTPPIVDMGSYEGSCQGFVLSTRSVTIPENGNATFTVALGMDPAQPVQVSVSPESGDADITVLSGGTFTLNSSDYSIPHTVTLHANSDPDNLAGTTVIVVAATGIFSARVAATELDDEPVTDVLHVDANATGGNNGATWPDAYTDLQTALTIASAHSNVTEIRVARGTYRPAGPSGSRASSFQLHNGLAITGSYAGSGQPNPDARSTSTYTSVLSGDLAGNDSPGFGGNAENCYHVVDAAGTDATAILDGLTISGGNANGAAAMSNGGGLSAGNGSPTITNCTFLANAGDSGAGLYKDQGNPLSLTDCRFIGNSASSIGGGLYCSNADANIIGCRFLSNHAAGEGGGAFLINGDTLLVANCVFSGNASTNGGGLYDKTYALSVNNCTFSRNSATAGAGGLGMYYGTRMVANCVFWGNDVNGYVDEYTQLDGAYQINYSCVQGWTGEMSEGTGNHGDNPLFIDDDGVDNIVGTGDDDLRLGTGSPCIDAGDNASVPGGITTDIDGQARFVDDPTKVDTGSGSPPIVDIGACERGLSPGDFDGNTHVDAADLAIFIQCATGPARLYDPHNLPAGCTVSPIGGIIPPDFDSDGDVDMDDFGIFQRCTSGPSISADPNCQ